MPKTVQRHGSDMDFAYLFERFPSLTQTFCYREVEEMRRQLGSFPVWSLRQPKDFSLDCPADLTASVHYLPDRQTLRAQLGSLKTMLGRFPLRVIWHVKRWGDRPRKYRLYEAAWLGRELRRHGVRHVHTHFAGDGARTAWWLRRLYGITYSFTGHANDMFCKVDDPVSLSTLVDDSSFVVTVSDFSRQWLSSQFPESADKIYRVYNGMRLSDTSGKDDIPDPPIIISVGRAIKKKGFSDLVKACGILRDSGLVFRCQIVGGGPLEQELRKMIAEMQLCNLVELTGALPWGEVRPRLGRASIFVLACISDNDGGMDNLPTVILEAMDAGVPVVSTHVAAIPEMVIDGVTGYLVSERDPQSLAASLAQLLGQPSLAKTMGEAGKAFARERFAVSETVAQLKELIYRYAV